MDGVSVTNCGKSFLVVTCHFYSDEKLNSLALGAFRFYEKHTADYIASRLKDALELYGINIKKVISITTDGAENIKKAVANLAIDNFHCIALIFNLIIQDAWSTIHFKKDLKFTDNDPDCVELKKLTDPLSLVSKIVTFFKQSLQCQVDLENNQDNHELKGPLKLIQDVVTRWNSPVEMLSRFVSLHASVNFTQIEHEHKAPRVLTPFKDATNDLSGETYATMSSVIPQIFIIREKLNKCTPATKPAILLLKNLKSLLKSRLGDLEALALRTLNIPASSVSSERVGSALKNLIGDRRTSLGDEYLSQRLFLKMFDS